MNRQITSDDAEFGEILAELALNREAVRRRQETSQASFREWLFEQVREIASRLGYVLQDIVEVAADLAYAFKKGINEGRERARRASIRSREGKP